MRRLGAILCALATLFALTAFAASSARTSEDPRPRPVCASKTPEASGTSQRTFVDGTVERTYTLRIPSGYDGKRARPVVYLLHGLGGDSAQFLTSTQFGDLADREGVILVAPQGQDTVGTRPGWDFTTPATQVGSDADFVKRLKAELDSQLCVDETREYLAGFSNGAALGFSMACAGNFGFAAYAGISAIVSGEGCSGSPAPIIYFHGTSDDVIPDAGGITVIGTMLGVDAGLASWVAHNACMAAPAVTQVTTHVQERAWSGCTAGADIESYAIADAGHAWPGSPTLREPTAGPTSDEISAATTMWGFFRRHRL
ncbi:MAG: hypothetical protein JWP10_2026 [Nocardioidaceae bacterium]|nr:hypothetical protein [Nocardioidaceae bacterium]